MKKTAIIAAILSLFAFTACELDLYSPTSFNKGNVETVGEGDSESQYTSKADMEALRNSLYNSWVKDIQEKGLLDWLIYSEVRADNAYCGTNTAEIMALEANKQDGSNKNVTRDWDWYQTQVSNANQTICNIDRICESDPEMTEAQRDQWKAEAIIWRAFNFFRLTQLWGDAPMVLQIPPAITIENVQEVYPLYYPDRTPMNKVYAQLVEDLTWAADHAPALDPANKQLMSQAFAWSILAHVYAEKPIRDWGKVIDYCTLLEGCGLSLEPNYGDLWGYDATDAKRNSVESIFEVQWVNQSQGNWVFMMFHRNAYDPGASYDWAKWVTPSRDLLQAYDDEGDAVRKAASIVWDSCGWSNYYPEDNYAFMHKCPTNVSSIIVYRLADILLLHAEALCCSDDVDGAAALVNQVRSRVSLGPLPASAKASKDAMLNAILKERRLELSFEGYRFFDLRRHDKIIEVHNAMNAKDSYWQDRKPLAETRYYLPVPTTALDNNPNMKQNPGY